MYLEADSASAPTNKKERGKPLPQSAVDRMLVHAEVRRRFERYTKVGRTHEEGPMSETDALDWAISDVFVGGRERGNRRFARYATPANVERMRQLGKGAVSVSEYLGDINSVRLRVAQTGDNSVLAKFLVAEYGGQNEDGATRPEVIRIIQAKMASNDGKAEARPASDEEFAAAVADT